MKRLVIILTATILIILPQMVFSQNNSFIPKDFEIPDSLENQYFRIRMLSVNDVEKDYDAVMTSIEHLQGVFGPESKWPSKDLTFEQDLNDLEWHQKEFETRSSFAYTIVSLDESQVLGCLYIYPSKKAGFDARIYMWVRESEVENGLDLILYNVVKQWIKDDWPFKNIAYPGRDISWVKWKEMK